MIWIIIICIVILFLLWKFYKIKWDTVIAFTGGLGSGKSFKSVGIAIRLLKKNRKKVKWHNRFERFKHFFYHKYTIKIKKKPLLYSSIPVRISRREWSVKLTYQHLLLVDKLLEKSIVFIDEVGSFANQYDHSNPNVRNCFDEFVRLFRHYTKGGYLVVNDQCSENIVLQIRRRINTVFNLMHFKVWFKIFYTVKVRNINISEEIKTIEEDNAEDNMRTLFGLMPLFGKKYDTYCYSERYNKVDTINDFNYSKYKKNDLLSLPKIEVKKKTN